MFIVCEYKNRIGKLKNLELNIFLYYLLLFVLICMLKVIEFFKLKEYQI